HALALLPICQSRAPDLLTGFRVVRGDATVRRSSKQPSVQIRGATIDSQPAGRAVFAHAPLLLTRLRVECNQLLVGRRVERAADTDWASLKVVVDVEVVDTHLPQARNVVLVDLIERGVALGGERAVVARPVGRCGLATEPARHPQTQDDGGSGEVDEPGLTDIHSAHRCPHSSGAAFSRGTGIEPKLLRWVDIGSRRRPDAGNLNPHGIVP